MLQDELNTSAVQTAGMYLKEMEKYLRFQSEHLYKKIMWGSISVALCFVEISRVQKEVAKTILLKPFSPRAWDFFSCPPDEDHLTQEQILSVRLQHVRDSISFLRIFLTDCGVIPLEIVTDSGYADLQTMPTINFDHVLAAARQWPKI